MERVFFQDLPDRRREVDNRPGFFPRRPLTISSLIAA